MINNKGTASILQVLPALNSGGVERGTVDLALYAERKGFRIIVVSGGGRMVEKLDKAGLEHICLNLNTKNPVKIFLNIFKLKKICRKNNVKIIHARSRAPAWSAYYAAKQLGIPFITTFHGFYKNNFPLKKYYNAIMAKGERVIAVSDFIREHIFLNYKVEPRKVVVIHRGVDLNEFDPANVSAEEVEKFKAEKFIPLNVPVILLPGRITRWKGHDVAIRAMGELKDTDFILAFAGNADAKSNYLKELIDLINTYGLEKKVRFLSDVKNMPVAYAASDIVLSTSVEPETFGRVSSEAGAMGKMVIASDHGGSKEIIDDNVTGFLVEVKNSHMLAVKIQEALKMLQDKNAEKELAIITRKHIAKNFSLEKMCESTLNIYNEIYKFNTQNI